MMFPTRRYEVSCRETGLCYGVYPGDDAFDAACNFYDDVGYATPGEAADAMGMDVDDMLDQLRIVEVIR